MKLEMDAQKQNEESLREAACYGDEEGTRTLVESGVNVNAQHSVNGWTPLHWAAKRGHCSIVHYLLAHGADPTLSSVRGENPLALTDKEEIRALLLPGSSENLSEGHNTPPLPITPSYLANPPLSHKVNTSGKVQVESKVNYLKPSALCYPTPEQELVLKIKTSDPSEKDFIEVEIPRNQLSYNVLLKTCCEELGINAQKVAKLRKLPNTIIRKDKDVLRLNDFQELEVILHSNKQDSYDISDDQCKISKSQIFSNGRVGVNGTHMASVVFQKSNFCKNGTILY